VPSNIILMRRPAPLPVLRRAAVAAELATRNGSERRLLRLARRLDRKGVELLLIMAERLAAETRAPPERR